jgi:hypothetical protein
VHEHSSDLGLATAKPRPNSFGLVLWAFPNRIEGRRISRITTRDERVLGFTPGLGFEKNSGTERPGSWRTGLSQNSRCVRNMASAGSAEPAWRQALNSHLSGSAQAARAGQPLREKDQSPEPPERASNHP